MSVQPHCFRHGVCAAVLTFTCGSWTQMIQSSSVCTGREECKSCLPARGTPTRRPHVHAHPHSSHNICLLGSDRKTFGFFKSITASQFSDEIDREVESGAFVVIHLHQKVPALPSLCIDTLLTAARFACVVQRSIWQCRCA